MVFLFRLGVLLLFLVGGAPCVRAQSAQIVIGVDTEELTPGQVFSLEVRAEIENADADNVKLPDLGPFEVLRHEVSNPMQFSFSFGLGGAKRIMRSTVIHRFELRAPQRNGRFSIGPARLRIKGRTYESNIVTLVIAGIGTGPSRGEPNSPSNAPPEGELTGADYDSQAFLRTVVSNFTPYVGEQVTLSWYLYLNGALRASPVVSLEPSAQGCWVHDLLASARAIEPTIQDVNGRPFRVYLLRRFAAFPLAPGKVEIGSMRATVPVGSLFDVFGGSPPRDLTRASNEASLKVKPLPSHGPPASAPVHVGNLTLSATVDRAQAHTLDAIKLELVAQGSGSLLGLDFELAPIPGLQIMEPQSHDEVRESAGVVTGTRTIAWLIVPIEPGNYTIPSFFAHAFNTDQASFAQIGSEPLHFSVVGKGAGASRALEAQDAEEVRVFGPLRKNSRLQRRHSAPLFNWGYLALLIAPPLGWLITVTVKYARRRRRPGGLRGHDQPLKANPQRLKHLASALEKMNPESFYAELTSIIQAALAFRLNTSVGNLTHRELISALEAKNVSVEVAEACIALLRHADTHRFGTVVSDASRMRDHLKKAEEVVALLEDVSASAQGVT